MTLEGKMDMALVNLSKAIVKTGILHGMCVKCRISVVQ